MERMGALYALRTVSSTASSTQNDRTPLTVVDSNDRRPPDLQIASPFLPPPCVQLLLYSQPIRPKQISDPLNEAVRAGLCGYPLLGRIPPHCTSSSSGSDHEVDSTRLSDMIRGFIQEEDEDACACDRSCADCSDDTGKHVCSETDTEEESQGQTSMPFLGEQLCHILKGMCGCINNLELRLLREAAKAIATAKKNAGSVIENEEYKSCLRRFVMTNLRSAGYNAAICKSRWEQTNGFPAGHYECIDIIIDGRNCGSERLFVEIDFRAQFEIARPTRQYSGLVQLLPNLFVGKAERLRQIIKMICDAAKQSFKKKGMMIPPWRKYRYMQAKWFGPYKRTTNAVSNLQEGRGNKAWLPDFAGIALNGTALDPRFALQMELHFGKATIEAKQTDPKEQRQGSDVGFEINEDSKLQRLPAASTVHKREPSMGCGKISGLASALAEGGLTSIFPSHGSGTQHHSHNNFESVSVSSR
eukprot:Gb_34690 [translate_table: standard]